MTDEGRRRKLISVFQDTQKFYAEDTVLGKAIKYSQEHTKLYQADDYPALSPIVERRRGKVWVIKARSFEAAMSMHRDFPSEKIAVLNFASATNPGGGVRNGSNAQEESLCRCSTLYPAINQKWLWTKYYGVNRSAHDCLHTDACIYSPGVIICKTDKDIPKRMKSGDFVTVDVITCAAPNLRHIPSNGNNPETGVPTRIEPQQLYSLHVRRAKHILHIAAVNNAGILILGAFGCGAFRNDPHIVAKAYNTAIEEYRDRFDSIVFAIYYRDYETENFNAFQQELCPERSV